MKFLYVIVLIKLCLDAGNDFSIILCNFGSLLVRGFKVIEVGLGSTRSPHPGPRRQKKASYEQRVKRICVFVFVAYDDRLSYGVSQPFATNQC